MDWKLSPGQSPQVHRVCQRPICPLRNLSRMEVGGSYLFLDLGGMFPLDSSHSESMLPLDVSSLSARIFSVSVC